MPGAIPYTPQMVTPDSSDQLLSNAEAQARSSLKSLIPGIAFQNIPKQSPVPPGSAAPPASDMSNSPPPTAEAGASLPESASPPPEAEPPVPAKEESWPDTFNNIPTKLGVSATNFFDGMALRNAEELQAAHIKDTGTPDAGLAKFIREKKISIQRASYVETEQQKQSGSQTLGQRATQSSVDMAVQGAGMVAAALAGGPIAAAVIADQETSNPAYAELRRDGIEPEKARMHSDIQGMVSAATSLVPVNRLVKPGNSIKRRLASYLAAQIPGVTVATISSEIDNHIAQLPGDATASDVLEGAAEGVKELPNALIATIASGGLHSVLAHAAVKQVLRGARPRPDLGEIPSEAPTTEPPGSSSPNSAPAVDGLSPAAAAEFSAKGESERNPPKSKGKDSESVVAKNATTEATLRTDEEPKTGETVPKMGIVKLGNGKEVAVHIEGEPVDGKQTVRTIDEATGEPSGKTISVPADSVRTSEVEPTKEPAKEPAKEPQAAESKVPTVEKTDEGYIIRDENGKKGPIAYDTAEKAQADIDSLASEAEAERIRGAEPAEPAPKPKPYGGHGESEAATAVEAAGATEEPAAKPKTSTAAKPKTAVESLSEALAAHEQQEAVPTGRKFASSLSERQDNASSFSAVLSAAARESKGKVPETLIDRATKAAKAAENLTMKSPEATAKGQGTSHPRISAINEEMHKVARLLLNTPKEGDKVPAVAPKAAALKARLAKVAERAKEEKPTATQEKPAKIVIKLKERTDQVNEPRQLSKGEELRVKKLRADYLNAEDKDVPAIREKLVDFLKRTYGDHYDPKVMDQVDKLMSKARNDAKIQDRLQEAPDEDMRYDHEGHDDNEGEHESNDAYEIGKHWAELHKGLKESGFFDELGAIMNRGTLAGGHALMNHIIGVAKDSPLRPLLEAIRSKMPDVLVKPTDRIVSLARGREGQEMDKAGGLFTQKHKVVQILSDPAKVRNLVSLIHEFKHSTTGFEITTNPHGEYAGEMQRLLDIARDRVEAEHGDAYRQALQYYKTKGQQGSHNSKFYGLTDVHEFDAEVATNPQFQKLIADSELYRAPGEELVPKKLGILEKVRNAVAKFLGLKETTLLDNAFHASEQLMNAQRENFSELFNKSAKDFQAELPAVVREALGMDRVTTEKVREGLTALREEPPPMHGERELHAVTGSDEDTKLVRTFSHVIRSGAFEAVRRVKLSLKSEDQLYRDHTRDFGHNDDPKNPMNMMHEAQNTKTVQMSKMIDRANEVGQSWLRLKSEDNVKVGRLMDLSTRWKIDPSKPMNEQLATVQADKKFVQRYQDFSAMWNNLPQEAQKVYKDARDHNQWAARENRRAGIDTALHSFDADTITPAQRALLYGAKSPAVFDSLIGEGKLIDIGDRNNALKKSLGDFTSLNETNGPYFHLGREGNYVTQVKPEGTKVFSSQAEAERFADKVRTLSPNSKAKVQNRGGQWEADYKAQHVSMHRTAEEAETAKAEMEKQGFDVNRVTEKSVSRENAPVTEGMRELVAEATRKINKHGSDDGSDALVQNLHSAFLNMMATRSSYAGSQLARKGVGGVKPEEMRRNFADHALSTAYNTASMRSVFEEAAALSKLREAARDSDNASISQDTLYRRGRIVTELGKRAQQEAKDYGSRSPLNSVLAKIGFMSYLASPSHAFIWMTQNFTTGIPTAGARWGYGKSTGAFARSMGLVAGPAFRQTLNEHLALGNATPDNILQGVLKAVRNDPHFGKWAKGDASHLQQLIDRGVISTSYANELGTMSHESGSHNVTKLFEFARLLPHMADVFNRVSTALAGLELTGGDIRKTGDFVRETHMDYSQGNKPRAFKGIGRIPGGGSVTMFKTYVQGMAHLLYSNIGSTVTGRTKSRAEAAKTVAGLIAGNSIFAGVIGGAMLEPLKLAIYAYHKMFDDADETYDLNNSIRRFMSEHFGERAGEVISSGAPRALGFDLSSRMGLSDLFLHDPPDLLTPDMDVWRKFAFNQLGPMPNMLAENVTGFTKHMSAGEPFKALSTLVPVKAFHDASKAAELYQGGKTSASGGLLIEPGNKMAAVYQALGLKPAVVARQQERSGSVADYYKFTMDRRRTLMNQYASADADKKQDVMEKIRSFNQKNPGERITFSDFVKQARSAQRAQAEAEGMPVRDPKINELLDY